MISFILGCAISVGVLNSSCILVHIGDVATDYFPDTAPEYEGVIEEYEEEVLVDGVPEAPTDVFADPVQNQGKPQCITYVF